MTNISTYDVAIVGGGLAGLSNAILLARAGKKVILYEKETYPFHKVCGEYISMESKDFISDLGVDLDHLKVSYINKLIITSPSGNILRSGLDLGGFGISRYTLDLTLKNIAEQHGVIIRENCKVENIHFKNDSFIIETNEQLYHAIVCCGSFGKKSNIDVKWKRSFLQKKHSKLNNYIGVKYHVKTDFPSDTIALHNFENGYCGISKIEEDKFCVCYLTTAANLKNSNNSIEEMETNILSRNPHLQKIFSNAEILYDAPVTISQISFDKKSLVHDHVLLNGDAAGMISPLCGNGMSMALHSAKILAEEIINYLNGKITRDKMEALYLEKWKSNFSNRLKTGRIIQSLFGKKTTTNLFIGLMKKLPFLTKMLIRKTHGQSF